MQAPTILGCLLVAVICTFKAEGCETDIASSNVEYLRELLLNDTKLFQKQVLSQLPDDAPSLQDLTQMFRDMVGGALPAYLKGNNYYLINNSTGGFNYSYANKGEINTTTYGMFGKNGSLETFSSVEFSVIKGSLPVKGKIYPYDAGTTFFTKVWYKKRENLVIFKASVLGSIISKHNGTYFSYGNYTGLSQGSFMEFENVVLEDVKNLGIFHNPIYYSANEISFTSKADATSSTSILNLISLTGGTNGTMTMKSLPATDDYTVPIVADGFLENSKYNSTLKFEGIMKTPDKMDNSGFFTQRNLPDFFGAVRFGADVYLP